MTSAADSSTVIPAIVIHGGAWAIPDALAEASCIGVQNAAVAGYRLLIGEDSSALDAVQAAVQVLEDDPAFDAGTGSVLNIAGDVEMDAIIMEGKHLKAGAVACVKNIRNPINLARLVMDKTDHVMLAGEGANLFATKMGISQVPTKELVTQDAIKDWQHYHKFRLTVDDLFSNRNGGSLGGHDTVGAVAVDRHGNVACATSTGGITAKMVGRVGDSPIIGCGAYCDNTVGAVSTTGHGESIMKVTLARDILYNMQQCGMTSQAAAEKSLAYMTQRLSGAGGAVVVSNRGDIGCHFTTERMAWASAKNGTVYYGINPGDMLTGKKMEECS